MKTLFRLIIVGILLYLGYKYARENHPSVLAELQPVLENISEITGKFSDKNQSGPVNTGEENIGHTTQEQDQQGNSAVEHTNELEYDPGSSSQSKERPSHDKREKTAEKEYENTSGEKAELSWIKHITKTYSPVCWKLLQHYDRLPRELSAKSEDGYVINSSKPVNTYHYVRYNTKLASLRSMSTNVHEITHACHNLKTYDYAKQHGIILKWDNTRGYIYLSPEEGYLLSFPRKMLFPSRKLVHRIPPSRRTFRFGTYINGNNSTQNDGVFGLLDEFHAYYFDSKFSYDMYKVYKSLYQKPGEGLIQWISHSQSAMAAFYEFHFFIQEYLLYMKETRPEHFKLLMQYDPFILAYGAVYKKYHQLIRDYRQLIMHEKERINKEGRAEAYLEGSMLWVRLAGSSASNGMDILHEDVEKLQPVLESNRYDPIKPYITSVYQ